MKKKSEIAKKSATPKTKQKVYFTKSFPSALWEITTVLKCFETPAIGSTVSEQAGPEKYFSCQFIY